MSVARILERHDQFTADLALAREIVRLGKEHSQSNDQMAENIRFMVGKRATPEMIRLALQTERG